MKTITFHLRDIDRRALQAIKEYLERTGLLVGKCSHAEAVRFCVQYSARSIAEKQGERGQPGAVTINSNADRFDDITGTFGAAQT